MAMNPKTESRTTLESTIKDTADMLHLQGRHTECKGEKQPMTLQEVISKMHWIQETKKKAS